MAIRRPSCWTREPGNGGTLTVCRRLGCCRSTRGRILRIHLGRRRHERLRALGHLAQQYLGRPYRKAEDGRTIATLTPEASVDEEIKRLLAVISAS
jgi:hypothetical protein